MLPLHISRLRPPRERRGACAPRSTRSACCKTKRRCPITLSGGEQQRLCIARAIVHRPAILLADEPTGNLDAAYASEIGELFRSFNQVGVTVVIATHDETLAARQLAPRVITLKQGTLAAEAASVSGVAGRAHARSFSAALGRLARAPLGSLLNIAGHRHCAEPAGGILHLVLANLQAASRASLPPRRRSALFLALDANRAEIAQIESRLKQHPARAQVPVRAARAGAGRTEEQLSGLADVIASLPQNPLPDAFVIDARDDAVPAALEALRDEIAQWPQGRACAARLACGRGAWKPAAPARHGRR